MTDQFGYEDNKYDVIMFNMSSMYDWDHGIVNRNYNILNTLQKEDKIHRIISVDFFPIGWKKGVKHYFQNILWEVKSAEMVYGDLTSACYQKSEKIYVYSSIDSLFSMKQISKELKRIEKVLNLKNIIFWSYNPMFVDFIGKLNEKLFVFDTVDNWTHHDQYTKMVSKKKLTKNYEKIAKTADLVFTVSKDLEGFYKDLGREKDTFWVPNGVDIDHYNDQTIIDGKTSLDRYTQPIIGYMGTMETRFDIDLVVEVAKKHPDKIIALCGPVWKETEKEMHYKFKGLENIVLTGRIPYKEAPAYFSRFNVGIVPHKVTDFAKSMNPMKFYEYMATGLPIVTTPVPGSEIFENKIYQAENADGFNQAITDALLEDSEELRQARITEAKRHSWHARVDEMIDQISLKLDWK